MAVDEPVRLVCPECELVYRLKKYRPGKNYACKNCGGALRPMEEAARPPATADNIHIHNDPHTNHEGARALDFEAGIVDANLAAVDASRNVTPPPSKGGTAVRAADPLRDQVSRLSQAVDALAGRMAAAGGAGTSKLEELTGLGNKIVEMVDQLDDYARDGFDTLAYEVRTVDEKLDETLKRADPDKLNALAGQIREMHERLAAKLDERPAPAAAPDDSASAHAVEIDIDDLAARLVAGVRAKAPRIDEESGLAVDALARVADELVREQSANSARLDQLSEAVRGSTASVEKLQEWRGDLPIQVADEIGRTVEERVVGPISGALARQAPAILSELQDNKLVDIVSRSVREAQRPLLREILAGGGRNGVPVWLFASILLPLLLILGYLFLPGDNTMADSVAAMADSVNRLEARGLPLPPETAERLRSIEDVVLDIHGEALAHVKNAAAQDEEIRNLNAKLAERDALIKEYSDAVQKQSRRLRAYEMRLTRLGVSPETVED